MTSFLEFTPPELVTMPEASLISGLGLSSLRRYRDSGALTSAIVGGRQGVTRSSLDGLLRELRERRKIQSVRRKKPKPPHLWLVVDNT